MNNEITDTVVRIKCGIANLKSLAYGYSLLGDIPIAITNINSNSILKELKDIEDYLYKEISSLETDIEVQK